MLEGDDYWTDENSLQTRTDFLELNDDFVMCFHNAQSYFEEEKQLVENKIVPFSESTIIESDKIINTGMPTLSFLFRNGLIDIFDEELLNIAYGDLILKAKLSQFGKAQYLHPIKSGVYRIHKGGVYTSQSTKIKVRDTLRTLSYVEQYFLNRDWNLTPIYQGYANSYFRFFIMSIKGSKQIKISYLLKCYRYSKKGNISFRAFFIKFYKNQKNKNRIQFSLKRKL